MIHESEHSESGFLYQAELSHAELFQSPTRYEGKERNVTLPAKNEEARDFLRSQQANRRSRKQLFQITFGISKQS